jgi:hypothetical protein
MVGLAGISLGADPIPDFGTTVIERDSVPWWQRAIFEGIDIARDRLMPENTYRVDSSGVVSRGGANNPAAIPVTDVRANVGANILGGSSMWLALLLGVLFLVVLSRGKK